MKCFNKEKFLNDLGQVYLEDLVDYDNPDPIVCWWTKMFTGILDKRPPPPLHKRKGKNIYSPWVTTDLVRKRRSRDIFKKRALDLNSEILMHAYRNLRNQVNRENERLKQQYFSNEIKRVQRDIKETWKTVNKLLDKRSKTMEILYSEEDREIITDPQDTTDKLNTYFSTIGEKLNSTFTVKDNSSLPPQVNSQFRFKMITEISVLKAIKALKPKSSFGPDKVYNFFIKIAAPVIAKSLANIYNTSIRSGIFPKDWKIAKVAPIFKSGYKSEMGDYRPVSVLPTLARIFERLVYDQLANYLEWNKYLTKYQSGFRKFHSTVTAEMRNSDDWLMNIDKGWLNGVIFFDLKKAFEEIRKCGFWCKLPLFDHFCGAPTQMMKIRDFTIYSFTNDLLPSSLYNVVFMKRPNCAPCATSDIS